MFLQSPSVTEEMETVIWGDLISRHPVPAWRGPAHRLRPRFYKRITAETRPSLSCSPLSFFSNLKACGFYVVRSRDYTYFCFK